jgi:hypothetical protein
MVGPQPADTKQKECEEQFQKVLQRGGYDVVESYLAEHPGEQCYLLVLDPQTQIVREFLSLAAPGWLKAAERLVSSTGGLRPGEKPPVFMAVVDRHAGMLAARFLAKNEEETQARMATVQDAAVGIGLLCDCILVFHLYEQVPCTDRGATERARRQARARRQP